MDPGDFFCFHEVSKGSTCCRILYQMLRNTRCQTRNFSFSSGSNAISHPPIRPMPHPHLQTNPDYPRRDLPGCRIRRADRSSRDSCRRFGFEMGCLVCTPADDKLFLLTPYRSSIPDFAAPRSEPPRFLWLPQIPDRDSRQRGSAIQTYTLAVQRVREVVDALPEEDAALLRALYLQTPPLTLRAYSEKTGIPVMTLHYRKEKLLRLLKQQI